MKIITIRLKPDSDLRTEIEKIIKKEKIKAGIILSGVGSLRKAQIRLADGKKIKKLNGLFEIVSLDGTLSKDGIHAHISIADKNGNVIGGHLKENCIINTTVELIIGKIDRVIFKRKFDKNTGYDELNIKNEKT